MREKPAFDSNLETECLFGETVEILEEKFEWVFCRLLFVKFEISSRSNKMKNTLYYRLVD